MGGAESSQKGDRYERRLVNFLDDAGYMVMRSPSSGSATKRDQPDVFAARRSERLAIELKYSGDPKGIIYLDDEETSALARLAHDAGATPVVAARWKRDPVFYLFEAGALEGTDGDGDTKRVRREICAEASVVLDDHDDHEDADYGRTPAEVDERGRLL